MTLAEQLEQFFKKNWEWHVKGDLLRMVWKQADGRTYMPTTVARTLNLMESKEHKIAVRPHETSNTVQYKFLPIEYRKIYIPYSSRPDENKSKLWSAELPPRYKIVTSATGATQVPKKSDEL